MAQYPQVLNWIDSVVSHPAFPILVAVVGWFVTNRIAFRAQQKQYVLEFRNDIRQKIADALLGGQRWLSTIHAEFFAVSQWSGFLKMDAAKERLLGHANRPEGSQWLHYLEHYELLFPGTREVRIELVKRHQIICRAVTTFTTATLRSDLHTAKDVAGRNTELVLQQVGLLNDVGIELQNSSLSPLIDSKIPKRAPTDDRVVRIVRDKDGTLRLKDGADESSL